MAQTGTETSTGAKPRADGPGRLSRWFQHRMNARMNGKVRKGKGNFMGMDVLILHTVGRHSGEERETPIAWFPDGEGEGREAARLVVASGGGRRHPDWYANLMAHAERASIELPGAGALAVTPQRLSGPERERAWERIAAAQPRIAKYQGKSDREYPVVRLTPR